MLHRMLLSFVFPAYAGVILVSGVTSLVPAGFPRIRGGDPFGYEMAQEFTKFSPHTRG